MTISSTDSLKATKSALYLLLVLFAVACSHPKVPEHFQSTRMLPNIYPDYTNVTIPVNIAPLSFELLVGVDEAVTRYWFQDEEIICEGVKARPDIDQWHDLCRLAADKSINVEVYVRKGEKWIRFQPFSIHVRKDSIDPWLSYRLISPSYVTYEELTLNQRCLENYEEQVMVDNMLCSTEAGGQCVNCHSYQQYNPQRMQFHARQTHGGTVIAYDGTLTKVDMKTDSTLSAAVYPAWHPTLPLIAYSTNKTMQSFHTSHLNKIEVFDTESDLIAYDIERNEIQSLAKTPEDLEIFPNWSPDGRWLYFCSAHFVYKGGKADAAELAMRAEEVKYNIYRMSFDLSTRQFGERELVFDADSLDRSATLPRISPDGKWLLFTVGASGCFHIWHHDADLWLLNLQTDQFGPVEELCSDQTESYHSWSSNGQWVVFSSRRNDGVFTRPFIAHIDKDGHSTKPFELPSQDPDYHRQLMKSYNVPELMRGPVTFRPQDFANILRGDEVRKAKFVGNKR